MAVRGKMTGIFEIFQRGGKDDLLVGFVKLMRLVKFAEETVSFLAINWFQIQPKNEKMSSHSRKEENLCALPVL